MCFFLIDDEEESTIESNIFPEGHITVETERTQPSYDDVKSVGVTRDYADESVGEYAVPRALNFGVCKTISDDNSPLARRELSRSEEQISNGEESNRNSEDLASQREILEINREETEKDLGNKIVTVKMNGNTNGDDNIDGVKELAASFQQAIHEETAKVKGKPPPVKPKSYKKAPPPVVAPKPKANGVKVNKFNHSPTGTLQLY